MPAQMEISLDADLIALSRAKLAPQSRRTADLERLSGLLQDGERVITLCEALCTSGRQEWRGLTVLTDERLICLYSQLPAAPIVEFRLTAVTSVEVGTPRGSGDAKRGELTMSMDGEESQLARIRPWQRAEEIAQEIASVIAQRN